MYIYKKKLRLVAVMLVVLSLFSLSCCTTNETVTTTKASEVSTTKKQETPQTTQPQTTTDIAQNLLKNMSLEEKIGQMFIVRPESFITEINSSNTSSTGDLCVTKIEDQIIENMAKYHVGGIILFSKNIVSPEQTTKLIDDLNENSKTPLFMSIDEEGGLVARVANSKGFDVEKFESMEAIGDTNDSQNAYDMAHTIGTYLKEYGFNLDFAPVSDINTNPKNRVIGSRAFGDNPTLVSEMVNSAIDGFHDAGVMDTIKHYPGHGDTTNDTHDGFVSIDKTWEELEECELIPFINALDKTDMVMVSHITAPQITSDGMPTSMSKVMVEEKLRGTLGYNGVVITDGLEMGAISNNYTSAETCVSSINAGVDIMLIPIDFVDAYEGVLDAVKNGTITEERINESVERILELKIKNNLIIVD